MRKEEEVKGEDEGSGNRGRWLGRQRGEGVIRGDSVRLLDSGWMVQPNENVTDQTMGGSALERQ